MGQDGDARQSPEHWHGRPPMHTSFDSWVNKNGKSAYRDFVKGHPKTGLSYDAWRRTDQVYGGYLFYIASLVWAEDGESDEENVKRRRISRVQGDNSKKTATTNGNGAPRTAGSATPTPAAISDEISASGKRKRKPRKKYMSQELVASDEEATDDVEAATPPETPAAPDVLVNGRRKSTSRKPRKKPISDETISPEDENDDTMMEVDSPIIASPLPVRSAPRTSAIGKQPESPRKAAQKQGSVKKSRKSLLVRLPFHLWDAVNLEEKSEEMVLDEETKNGDASVAEVSRPASTPAAKSKSKNSNSIETDLNADEGAEVMTAEGTPDPSTANTRRGLRNRKPAQQRPYYHDAQVFEDVETEQDEDSELESVSREQSIEPPPSKPRHFKGKGRAWKKDGSDEDEEFVTPKEKKVSKAARAKADREKAKSEKETGEEQDITWALMDALDANTAELDDRPTQPNGSSKYTPKQKKTRKPRKSNLLSDEVVARDDSDPDTPQPTPSQPPKRGRGRPRKSALSSEIVRDESDDDTAVSVPAPGAAAAAGAAKGEEKDPSSTASPIAPRNTTIDLTTPSKTKPASRPSMANLTAATPRKRGRPRKSETAAAAAAAAAAATATAAATAANSSTPAKPAVKAEQGDETEKQTLAETGPKSTRARTSVSSASGAPAALPTATEAQDYPVPLLNRGAALVESLYPREVREDSKTGDGAAEPSAGAAGAVTESAPAPATEPAKEVSLAATGTEEAPTEKDEAEAEPETKTEAKAEAQTEPKTVSAVETVPASAPPAEAEAKTEPESEPAVQDGSAPAQEAQELENKGAEKEDEDAQSAAMSLSDDSEL